MNKFTTILVLLSMVSCGKLNNGNSNKSQINSSATSSQIDGKLSIPSQNNFGGVPTITFYNNQSYILNLNGSSQQVRDYTNSKN